MSTMSLPPKSFLSVREAAEIIGCTEGRVRQLLIDKEIDGEKLNERAWAVERKSVDKFAAEPQVVGRPRKHAEK
jgi:excisionase family DNA binding protein